MLRRLAWSSVPSSPLSAARLNEIVAPSRRNNERNHVSGMLLLTGAHFLGILEGQELDLHNLWQRLEWDERHSDLIRIGHDRCGKRWFPEWMMAYMDDAVVGPKIEILRSSQAWIASKWAEMIHPIMLRADSMSPGNVPGGTRHGDCASGTPNGEKHGPFSCRLDDDLERGNAKSLGNWETRWSLIGASDA